MLLGKLSDIIAEKGLEVRANFATYANVSQSFISVWKRAIL